MALKRKRSEPELCSSPASSSIFSSPPGNRMMDISPQAFYNMPIAHLNSRTFKRVRDNRPSEEQVHQHTLQLLYSAQQQQKHITHDMSLQIPQQAAPAPQPTRQQSLHRFWNINSMPTSIFLSTAIRQQPATPLSCEDCGVGLGNDGSGDVMDMGGALPEDTACGACRKHVCFSCSVSNLGEERRCLQCAGDKAWAGSIGWTNAGVSIS